MWPADLLNSTNKVIYFNEFPGEPATNWEAGSFTIHQVLFRKGDKKSVRNQKSSDALRGTEWTPINEKLTLMMERLPVMPFHYTNTRSKNLMQFRNCLQI